MILNQLYQCEAGHREVRVRCYRVSLCIIRVNAILVEAYRARIEETVHHVFVSLVDTTDSQGFYVEKFTVVSCHDQCLSGGGESECVCVCVCERERES